MLPPASRAQWPFDFADLGLAPRALCFRPLRGLNGFLILLTWGLRSRLYASARFAGSMALLILLTWGLRPRLYASARFAGSDAMIFTVSLLSFVFSHFTSFRSKTKIA